MPGSVPTLTLAVQCSQGSVTDRSLCLMLGFSIGKSTSSWIYTQSFHLYFPSFEGNILALNSLTCLSYFSNSLVTTWEGKRGAVFWTPSETPSLMTPNRVFGDPRPGVCPRHSSVMRVPGIPSAYLRAAPRPGRGSLPLHLQQGAPQMACPASPVRPHRPPSPAPRGGSSVSTTSGEQAGGKENAVFLSSLWREVRP